jgi:hypothetical protein
VQDLFLKHSDATLAIYKKKRQMKHLIHASETLAKTLENHCKHTQHLEKHLQHMCENICNIQINMLATYV